MKKGYSDNIEKLTLENEAFRKVLYTAEHSQLVLMSLNLGEEIGEEVHDVDQFFRIEAGEGEMVINDNRYPLSDGSAVVVPAGAKHNLINKGATKLKLYTIYSPAHHKDGTLHTTKKEGEEKEEHFDGKTTE